MTNLEEWQLEEADKWRRYFRAKRDRPQSPIVVRRTRADAVYDSWWVATWCGSIAASYDSAEHAVERLRARMSAHAGKVPVLYYTRPRA